MLQLLGAAFALLQQQQLSVEKGGTVPFTPRAPFFSKNSFLLLLCRQGGERREGGRGAEANLRVLQVSHKEGQNRPDRFTKLTGNQFRSALKISRLLPGNQNICFSAAFSLLRK